MPAAAFLQRHRRALIVILSVIAALLLAAILLLSFGWALLRKPIEYRLSQAFGRPVTIASIRRIDHGLLHPVLQIDDVHVGQPDWAGRDDMIAVHQATVQLPLVPLLVGRASPQSIAIDGLRIALVRSRDGRVNWKGLPGGGGGGSGLHHLIIREGVISLADARRDHHLLARLAADDAGFHIAGGGALAGHPATIALSGPAITGSQPWPFRLDYRSAIANGTLIGRADHPLDLGHFSARATAWGDDLQHLDLLIEAGLPATQPAHFTADLRHDQPDWTIDNLDLHIGRSNLAGNATVRKGGGRTRVDGTVTSTGLDFDDLANNQKLAKAAAQAKRIGPRLIPDTAIHLEHMQQTDGSIRFDLKRLLSDKPSIFRAVRGTLTLDHGVLTAQPLVATLTHGQASGMAQVVHHSGTPRLTLDLRVSGAQLAMMAGDAASGALAAHIRLAGDGRTVRAAIGRASGTIGMVGRDGAINRRAALFLGSDAGRALFGDKSDKTGLRCLIARFDARGGIATAAPLLLDTDVSQSRGAGTIALSTEQIALTFHGQPKLKGAVELKLPIQIAGNLSQPRIVPESVPKTVGTVFKLIGHAIAGDHAAPVPDADCGALGAQALR